MGSLFEMTMERKADFTEVFMQSHQLEALFKDWSMQRTFDVIHGNFFASEANEGRTFRAYKIPDHVALLRNVNWGTFEREVIYQGFQPRYLTLVGLGEGVKFHIMAPVAKTAIEQCCTLARDVVKDILREYVKPINASLIINSEDLVIANGKSPKTTEV